MPAFLNPAACVRCHIIWNSQHKTVLNVTFLANSDFIKKLFSLHMSAVERDLHQDEFTISSRLVNCWCNLVLVYN